MAKRIIPTKGYHTIDTLSIKTKDLSELVKIKAEGISNDIWIRIIPKGEGKVLIEEIGGDIKIEGTLSVDNIVERTTCGVEIEGSNLKNGQITTGIIKADTLLINTISNNIGISGQYFTVNELDEGPGITGPGKMSGFIINRGIAHDYLIVRNDILDVLQIGFENCTLKNVHASESVTESLIPFALSGNCYEESVNFTFDKGTNILNVEGDITISGSPVTLYSELVAVSGYLDNKIDEEIFNLRNELIAVSGALDEKIDIEIFNLRTEVSEISASLDEKIDFVESEVYSLSAESFFSDMLLQDQINDVMSNVSTLSADHNSLQNQVNDLEFQVEFLTTQVESLSSSVAVLTSTPSGSGDPMGVPGNISYDNFHLYMRTDIGWGRTILDYNH